MWRRSSRSIVASTTLGAILVATAVSLGAASTARAAFDVVPFGCIARPQAYDDTGSQDNSISVWGYDNPNPTTVSIAYGPDNLILQPPNFRQNQPTDFASGTNLASWVLPFDSHAEPVLDWTLQGAEASTTPLCGGGSGPEPQSLPALGGGSGPAAVGDSLAVTDGSFSDPAGPVDAVVERCDGEACVPVTTLGYAGGLPSTSYSVTARDAGYTLRVRAVQLTMYGWASALSAPVVVAGSATGAAPQPAASDPSALAPEPLTEPSVSGTAGTGLTLVADAGAWAGAPTPALGVRWQRCTTSACADIPGATGRDYVPVAADVGDRLRAVVAASQPAVDTFGPSGQVVETAASEPTAAVSAGPAVQSPPVISGGPDIGSTLTLQSTGRYSDPVTTSVQWQWCDSAGCQDIPGATGASYEIGDDDAGRNLRATVTAVSAGGQTTAQSNQLGPAGAVRMAAAPRVIGDRSPGAMVWTDGGSWIGDPAPGLRFQWLRCDSQGVGCMPIPGATGPGYEPVASDVGQALQVTVTASNRFSSLTATSPSSVAVSSSSRRAPRLSHLRAWPRRFRAGEHPTTLRPTRHRRPSRGTIIVLRLSESAWLRFDIQRRERHGFRTVATLTGTLSAGAHRLHFTGRLAHALGGRLAPGGYRLRVRPFDAAGRTSGAHILNIWILR